MKHTSQLIKLLKKKDTPESIVKYIYINVYELIKESLKFIKLDKYQELLESLSDNYTHYYKTRINISEELWVRTIFPPYINGYKNFYRGIAGRLAFFSKDLNIVIEELNSPNMNKYRAANIVSDAPDTYYWYGNPLNWSYCYEIKLNELKEIVIRKRQIFVLEDEYAVYEAMVDEKEVPNDIHEILLLYKQDEDINRFQEQPDSFPTRAPHIASRSVYGLSLETFTAEAIASINACIAEYNSNINNYINNLMERYKTNVSIKNGYNIEIQKLWDEYNENFFYSSRRKFPIKYINHKIMGEEEIKELEDNFLTEYKEKVRKLKEKKKN